MVGEAGAATANDDGPEQKLFAEWRTVAWDEPGNEVTTLTTPNGPCGADVQPKPAMSQVKRGNPNLNVLGPPWGWGPGASRSNPRMS